jgi:hypothetical protein
VTQVRVVAELMFPCDTVKGFVCPPLDCVRNGEHSHDLKQRAWIT